MLPKLRHRPLRYRRHKGIEVRIDAHCLVQHFLCHDTVPGLSVDHALVEMEHRFGRLLGKRDVHVSLGFIQLAILEVAPGKCVGRVDVLSSLVLFFRHPQRFGQLEVVIGVEARGDHVAGDTVSAIQMRYRFQPFRSGLSFFQILPECYSNGLYKSLSITVIIPCLNEEQGIERVLSRMPSFVDQVIVVDNGSTDRTADVAKSFGAHVIREEVRGYGRAYKRGFRDATGDVIITLDGDHSYPVDAISYLVEAMLHLEADFLNGSRFPVRDRHAMSFKHKFGNWMLSMAMSLLYFRWVRDSQSGMWVFRRSILKDMKLISDGMAFSEEIKIEALKNSSIRFQEISIQYSSRLGEIKLNPWRDGFNNLWFLVQKRFS